jgi:hypothetical protein
MDCRVRPALVTTVAIAIATTAAAAGAPFAAPQAESPK